MKQTVNNATYKTTIHIGASRLKQMLWYITNIVFFKNPLSLISSFKIFLLKGFGASVGKGVVIKPCVNIKYPWKLQIGNYSWIGENVWIDNLANVRIGDSVCISQGAFLLTGNHDYTKSTFNLIIKEITLEDGVWIGAKAIVCPGVNCRSHSVLGVNSVASSDMNDYTIYRGNPAIAVKERNIII